nr:MAG TPA: hypothetical protein [Caudoviricetes sp.]
MQEKLRILLRRARFYRTLKVCFRRWILIIWKRMQRRIALKALRQSLF